VNLYWRSLPSSLRGRNVRVVISKDGKAYRRAVKSIALRRRLRDSLAGARVRAELYFFPPDRRTRDIDNLPKAILDSITHAKIWADDNCVDALDMLRCEKKAGGTVVAVLTEVLDSSPKTYEQIMEAIRGYPGTQAP